MSSTIPENKKIQIILAGVRVFARKGYHAVNVEEILRAANVSRATFYAHFENKEHLFTTIVDHLLTEQSAYILEVQERFLSMSRNVVSTIETIVRRMEQAAKTNPDALRIYFDVILGSGTQAEQRFRRMQQVTLDHFTEMIHQLMQARGYSSQAAMALAYMLIGGLKDICRMILNGEMTKVRMEEFLQGIKELFTRKEGFSGKQS